MQQVHEELGLSISFRLKCPACIACPSQDQDLSLQVPHVLHHWLVMVVVSHIAARS